MIWLLLLVSLPLPLAILNIIAFASDTGNAGDAFASLFCAVIFGWNIAWWVEMVMRRRNEFRKRRP